jgi:hypothetical protein
MEISKSTSPHRTQLVLNVVEESSTILATIANQNKQRIAKALSHRDENVIFAYEINSIFACSVANQNKQRIAETLSHRDGNVGRSSFPRRLCLTSIGGIGWLMNEGQSLCISTINEYILNGKSRGDAKWFGIGQWVQLS